MEEIILTKEVKLSKYPLILFTKYLTVNETITILNINKELRSSVLGFCKLFKVYLHTVNLVKREYEENLALYSSSISMRSLLFKNNFLFLRQCMERALVELATLDIKVKSETIPYIMSLTLANLIGMCKNELVQNENPYLIRNHSYENNSYQILSLSGYEIEDDIIDVICGCLDILQKEKKLYFNAISLSNNKFTSEKIREILRFASSAFIQLFDFSTNKCDIPSLESIFKQILSYTTLIPNYHIHFLDFSDCEMIDGHMNVIAHYIEKSIPITALALNSNHFQTIDPLSNCISGNLNFFLKHLRLNGLLLGKNLTPFLNALSINHTIKVLYLSKNLLMDVISELAVTLAIKGDFIHLEFQGNKIDDESAGKIIHSLFNNLNLRILSFGYNYININAAEILGKYAALRDIQLQNLQLQGNKINDDSCSALMDGLKSNQSIITLDLSGNQIGEKGSSSISQFLRVNTNLLWFSLKQNQLGSRGGLKIFDGLAKNSNSHLKTLILSNNEINDEISQGLKTIINGNQSLEKIILDCNLIGDKCIEELITYKKKKNSSIFISMEGMTTYD